MPINYKTDEKEVIAHEYVPVIDLRNNNLQEFEEALTEYVRVFLKVKNIGQIQLQITKIMAIN